MKLITDPRKLTLALFILFYFYQVLLFMSLFMNIFFFLGSFIKQA